MTAQHTDWLYGVALALGDVGLLGNQENFFAPTKSTLHSQIMGKSLAVTNAN